MSERLDSAVLQPIDLLVLLEVTLPPGHATQHCALCVILLTLELTPIGATVTDPGIGGSMGILWRVSRDYSLFGKLQRSRLELLNVGMTSSQSVNEAFRGAQDMQLDGGVVAPPRVRADPCPCSCPMSVWWYAGYYSPMTSKDATHCCGWMFSWT